MENEEKVDPELPSGGGSAARKAPEPPSGEEDTVAFEQRPGPESASPESADPEGVDPELPSGGG